MALSFLREKMDDWFEQFLLEVDSGLEDLLGNDGYIHDDGTIVITYR